MARKPDTDRAIVEDAEEILQIVCAEREEAIGDYDDVLRDLIRRVKKANKAAQVTKGE